MGMKLLIKWGALRAIREEYKPYFPVIFFLFGLIFDIVMTGRIDDPKTLIQHALFLFVIGLILYFEFGSQTVFEKFSFTQKFWSKRESIIHFLFGGLLSSYTIFYFKSTSALSSLGFFLVLAVLLILNESPRLRQSNNSFKIALFSLCLSTYLVYVIPIFIGVVNPWIFHFSILTSFVPIFLFLWILNRRNQKNERQGFIQAVLDTRTQKTILFPFAVLPLVFVLFYWLKIIPPVPLSIQYMGIYHDISKQEGQYLLHHEKPWWAYWRRGDQVFQARPGDRVYCFARIFSPSNFGATINVRWFRREERGWTLWNEIPIQVQGGRTEGFRAYTYKENYAPGDWRVHFDTSDGREIGRIFFQVKKSSETSPRIFQVDTQ